jgi:hypothetical protein
MHCFLVCPLKSIKLMCRQSENFTANVGIFDSGALSIHPNPDMHGTGGPLQVAYPKYVYNASSAFFL